MIWLIFANETYLIIFQTYKRKKIEHLYWSFQHLSYTLKLGSIVKWKSKKFIFKTTVANVDG